MWLGLEIVVAGLPPLGGGGELTERVINIREVLTSSKAILYFIHVIYK